MINIFVHTKCGSYYFEISCKCTYTSAYIHLKIREYDGRISQ